MEKKKSIIKSIKHGLTIAAASVLTAATITGAATMIHEVNDVKSQASINQIEQSADALGIDTSYVLSYKSHIQHNGNEPIYITIDKNVPDEMRGYIIESLDHIFGLAGQFNEKYRYEIVDSLSPIDKKLKASINFTMHDFEDKTTMGDFGTSFPLSSYALHETSTKNNKIRISTELIGYSDKQSMRQYISRGVINHELLHVFGADDVYDREGEIILNSNMTDTTYASTMITPKDLKVLAYMCQDKFETKEEKDSYAKKCEQIHKDYEKEYYQYIVKGRGGNISSKTTNISNIKSNIDLGPVAYTDGATGKVAYAGIKAHRYLSVSVDGDDYFLKLTMEYEDKEEVFTCFGKAIRCGDTLVLKDVNMPDIIYYGKNNVLDLFIRYGRGLDDQTFLVFTTDYTIKMAINMDYEDELSK